MRADACCGTSCPAPPDLCTEPAAGLRASNIRRTWISPDPLLSKLGVRYLQLGGDWWNRCGDGWLNIDGAFAQEGLTGQYQYGTDDKGGRNMQLVWSSVARLPFHSNSVLLVYSEHMIEHMLPEDGAALLSEVHRVLAPGGVLRLATPDLTKYMCGYVHPSGNFLRHHAQRFQPMTVLGRKRPPSDATVVNNIFRNYGHQWVYDYDELVALASTVGIDAQQICRTDRRGLGLPRPLRRAIQRATQPRNKSLACWLDQAVREDESLYVQVRKAAPSTPVNRSSRRPFCVPLKGWLPCDISLPIWAQSQF